MSRSASVTGRFDLAGVYEAAWGELSGSRAREVFEAAERRRTPDAKKDAAIEAFAERGVIVEFVGPLPERRPGEIRPNFPKRCSCGREHSAECWAMLPNRRIWPDDSGDSPGWTLEQRDCPCGSSIAIHVPNPAEGE